MKKSSDGSTYTDEEHEEEIYRKEFVPRSRVFSSRGFSATYLRSNKGYVYLAGTVAVVSNGLIEWFTHHDERFSGENPTIDFLKALLVEGGKLLDELCSPVKGSPTRKESSILNELEKSRMLGTQFQREVPVGSKGFPFMDGNIVRKEILMEKYIDAVCEYQGRTWIIEAKEVLNYQAIGQVLVYEDLYKEEYKTVSVEKAIACRILDQELLPTCKRLGIAVFVVGENPRRVV